MGDPKEKGAKWHCMAASAAGIAGGVYVQTQLKNKRKKFDVFILDNVDGWMDDRVVDQRLLEPHWLSADSRGPSRYGR